MSDISPYKKIEYLPHLNVSSFETLMMHNEFERLENRLRMETLSMKRYDLPPPPRGKLNEVHEFSVLITKRIFNLQLVLEYCCPAWQ